jgi:hypothetical protein
MFHDPSAELRRDAIAVLLKDAQQHFDKASAGYQKALASAADQDQVELIAKQLKSLGVEVKLADKFGFLQKWMLLAPFDNTKDVGFGIAYPPEERVELEKTFKGKKDAVLHWVEHTTTDPYGVVDFNKAIGKHMAVTAYAFTVVDSPTERPVQFRAGCNSAIKIFLNGKEIYFREEYHHGFRMDQHIATGRLKRGRNEILVKVCQNDQKDDWAQKWDFQLRVCDDVGSAVPVTIVLPAKKTAARLEGDKK